MPPPPKPPPRETPPGLPRPPMFFLLGWLIVLVLVPTLMFVLKDGGKGFSKPDLLTQSQLEEALKDKRVTKTETRPLEGYVFKVTGEYRRQKTNVTGSPEAKDAQGEKPRPFEAKVIYSETVDKLIRDNSEERDCKIQNSWLGPVLIQVVPLLLLLFLGYYLFSRQIRRGGGAMDFGKSRARLWTASQNKVTFADVCGVDEAKEEVQEIVDYLKDPAKFQKLGGRIPRGVLMIGPPGTGKTLLGRAIAGEAGVPFFSISGSDFVEMFVGVGASRVRDMFEEAQRNSPCLIFIDEIDAVGRSRFSGIGGGHDEREQTLNALLVQMDGFEASTGVIVIAATNRPDVLDPALLRPGRFDRQVTVDLPDVKGRAAILKVHASKTTLSPTTDLTAIARGTPGFSGADLANLVNEAALLAARHNKTQIEQADLEEARDKVCWGKERRSRKIDERERRLTAFHEAGHALAGLHCEHAEPLHKITIIPRGNAYLGATMSLPEQDRYTRSRAELVESLVVLMGGRVAEEIVFQDVTTGASQDIRQATALAKKMVCEWGMSARMGLINYGGGRSEHIFLGRDMIRNEEYSEVTAREIDEEIRKLVDGAHTRTNEILSLHRDQLDLLATTLLERETLNAVDVYELLGMEEKLAAVKKAAEEAAKVQAEELAALTAVKVTPQPEDDDETRRRRLEGLSLDDHPHHDDGGKPPKA